MNSPAASAGEKGPLDGVTVLDLTRVLSGPYCTMLLGDMGARVIKVEQPGRGDDTRAWGPPFVQGESAYFLSINRNKESVAIDFKRPSGRHVLDALIDRADVLVENFRPGTLDRMGLGYEALSRKQPPLIYCTISGFGLTGPKRDRLGYDAVVQAEGGLMSITGPADGEPYRLGVAIADMVAGMFATQGILLALLARQRTGKGQHIDVGMLDSVAALLTYQAGIYFTTGVVPRRMGNRHPSIAPYDTFETADGTLVLAVGNDDQWNRLCETLRLEALAADPQFRTNAGRVQGYDRLRAALTPVFRTRTRNAWIDCLMPAGVPCAAVRNIDEMLSDPQLAARAMIESIEHATAGSIKLLGIPVKLSGTPGAIRRPPPLLGQHAVQVLTDDLGLSKEQVAALIEEGAIAAAVR